MSIEKLNKAHKGNWFNKSKQEPNDKRTYNELIDKINELIDNKQDLLNYTPEDIANKDNVNGYASLDNNGVVPESQLPARIINIDYNSLTTLINSNSLKPGQKYRITDFATVHNMYDGKTHKIYDINIGPNEPLIVTAISNNKLDKQAISEQYPFDYIEYDVNIPININTGEIDIAFADVEVQYTVDIINTLRDELDGQTVVIAPDFQLSPGQTLDGIAKAFDYYTVHTNWQGIPNNFALELIGRVENYRVVLSETQEYSGTYMRDNTIFRAMQPMSNIFKGVILYRKDTKQNVSCYYDFRNVKFRRWLLDAQLYDNTITYTKNQVCKDQSTDTLYKCVVESTTGQGDPSSNRNEWIPYITVSGMYFSWTSDIQNFQIGDVDSTYLTIQECNFSNEYTFGNYYDNSVFNTHINKIMTQFLNNTIIQTYYGCISCFNNILNRAECNTILGSCYNNIVKNEFNSNIIKDEFGYNSIDTLTNNMIFVMMYTSAENVQDNVVSISQNNTLKSSFRNNNIAGEFRGNTILQEFYENVVNEGSSFANNTATSVIRLCQFKSHVEYCIFNYVFNFNIISNINDYPFQRNTFNVNVNNTDFTNATHVYEHKYCEIIDNMNMQPRLRYLNANDTMVYTNVNS